MKIVVIIKTVYGVDKIYPVCQLAQEFAKIAGTKTLSERDLTSIRRLGFNVMFGHQHLTTEMRLSAQAA